MNKFEKVSRFKNQQLIMPTRATELSAGYDICSAEDIIIPSYPNTVIPQLQALNKEKLYSLNEVAELTKSLPFSRPTLISTGMKCQLDKGKYLELVMRSSIPLKNWLICANSVGVIDADYYNNPKNEGEIFLQVINLSPFDIEISAGDKICQGIIKSYGVVEDDTANGIRVGGFGSTNV